MAARRINKPFVFFAACLWVMLMSGSGCGPSPGHRAFVFFFPPKTDTAKKAGRAVPPPPEKESPGKDAGPAVKPQDRLLVSHKPYIERKCKECHKGASAFTVSIFGKNWDGLFRKGGGIPGQLILPKDKICVKCHEDLSMDWAKKNGLILHTTAAKGECLKCHDAHQSRHPALLREDKDALCVVCHKQGDPAGVSKCFTEAKVKKPCLSCHNPHLGKNKSLLKKDYLEGKHPVSPEKGQPDKPVPPPDTQGVKHLSQLNPLQRR